MSSKTSKYKNPNRIKELLLLQEYHRGEMSRYHEAKKNRESDFVVITHLKHVSMVTTIEEILMEELENKTEPE